MTATSRGLPRLEKPELVFGLIGAVGTDLESVSKAVSRSLTKVGYKPVEIRISELIHQITKFRGLRKRSSGGEAKRIELHMRAGTALRKLTGRGEFLALLAIAEIRRLRVEAHRRAGVIGDDEKLSGKPLEATAYIIRSLKNPAEVETFRLVYGRALHVISAYSPRPARVENLASKFRKSDPGRRPDAYRTQADKLIQIDESEGDPLGQNVRTSFPLADLFVEVRKNAQSAESIGRFVSALFGNQFITPSADEQSMFFASAASLRSADLARQVGAAIVGQDGELITTGCNEVPKFDGGFYWPGPGDQRDFQVGGDSSDDEKRNLVSEIVTRLHESGWLSKEKTSKSRDSLVQALLDGDSRSVLRGTQLLSVIEFGRSVHAEMAAITDAARRGVSVRGTTLYCTTFPCHLCARHIIAAGIQRVVYIEPYPKSIAGRLYHDSMTVDPEGATTGRVRFEPFVGVSPKLYRFLFTATEERKTSSGEAKDWDRETARPRLRRIVPSYLLIEEIAVLDLLQNLADDAKLRFVKPSRT